MKTNSFFIGTLSIVLTTIAQGYFSNLICIISWGIGTGLCFYGYQLEKSENQTLNK